MGRKRIPATGHGAACPTGKDPAAVSVEANRASTPTPSTIGSRAGRWFGRCFHACGGEGPPETIDCLDARYRLRTVFKHDFLAVTALYERQGTAPARHEAVAEDRPLRVICKINRRMHFCLLPLGWLGRLVTAREIRHLERCSGIDEVPRVLARPDRHSYVYAYVEGRDLGRRPALPADFFDRLIAAVRRIHERGLIHFDLHKPGNILLGDDGRPHIIDFQLSMHLGDRCLLSKRLSQRVREYLQAYDVYHVYKHKRRLQPERLTKAEERLSRNTSLPLQIHRAIARPYKFVRRSCLRYLHAKGILGTACDGRINAETDPARWMKR